MADNEERNSVQFTGLHEPSWGFSPVPEALGPTGGEPWLEASVSSGLCCPVCVGEVGSFPQGQGSLEPSVFSPRSAGPWRAHVKPSHKCLSDGVSIL